MVLRSGKRRLQSGRQAQPHDKDDIPHLVANWKQYRKSKNLPVDTFVGHKLADETIVPMMDWTDRTQKAFVVPKQDLKGNKYDLSINRYKEVVYEEEVYDPPKEILGRLKTRWRLRFKRSWVSWRGCCELAFGEAS
ncbi:hypothetical protein [Parendozoicomonas sp. Alg238-R29]|uniref:hypothetical protein n=1 Tax=Parendozoicomonas sp. Alg238-R29 TaxID=2993446 RepID=UPI00248F0103|nr:hypothetical protein [Parendozoicomonas sp. Alg238-R29]